MQTVPTGEHCEVCGSELQPFAVYHPDDPIETKRFELHCPNQYKHEVIA